MQNLKSEIQNNTYGTNTVENAASEPIRLYIDVLNTFHNGLMLSLFWQNMRYISYFYPPEMTGRRIILWGIYYQQRSKMPKRGYRRLLFEYL